MEKEVRQINVAATVEKRGKETGSIVGYAIVYNRDSEDMGFVEQIAPGAVKKALARSDVRGLKNHDPSLIFARQGVNLELTEDNRGLKYVATPIDTRNFRDVAAEIESGLLTGQSFGFTVTKDEWRDLETDQPKRTITEIGEIFDVGPVTYPAYSDTTVALRSMDAARSENEAPQFRPVEDITLTVGGEDFVFNGEDCFERVAEKIEELRASSSPTTTEDADLEHDPTITDVQDEDDILDRITQTINRSKK